MNSELTLRQLRMLREGLERACGVPLLERVGRNVRLTDAGREMVRHADQLLDGAEATLTAVEQVGTAVTGTLQLAVFESVAASLLPRLLAILGADHPDLVVRTRQLDPDQAIEALAAGDIDLAFAIDYPHAPVAPRADLVRWSMIEDHFHLVVADADPITGSIVALADVADRSFVSSPVDFSCGRCVVTACHSAGFEPTIVHELACRAASAERPAVLAARDTTHRVVTDRALHVPERAA